MFYRFQIQVEGRDTSEDWFIGDGDYYPTTGVFTGSLTIDFEHHLGKGQQPTVQIDVDGANAYEVWARAFSDVGFGDYPSIVVPSLSVTNVSIHKTLASVLANA